MDVRRTQSASIVFKLMVTTHHVLDMRKTLMVLTQRFPRRLNAIWSNKRIMLLEIFSAIQDTSRQSNYVFNFVTEHLGEPKLFVRNKIAELGPLKIQLSVFVQMMKPMDETKVGCHANTKSKTLTTGLSDDEICVMIDKINNSSKFFQWIRCSEK